MENSKIKQALGVQEIFSAMYFIVYIINTIVIWKIENPFKWILEMGSYSEIERIEMLSVIVGGYVFAIIVHGLMKLSKQKSTFITSEEMDRINNKLENIDVYKDGIFDKRVYCRNELVQYYIDNIKSVANITFIDENKNSDIKAAYTILYDDIEKEKYEVCVDANGDKVYLADIVLYDGDTYIVQYNHGYFGIMSLSSYAWINIIEIDSNKLLRTRRLFIDENKIQIVASGKLNMEIPDAHLNKFKHLKMHISL